ncbi:MAG TPA: phosphatidylserine/phosphatidylglycerophosphate/cardiolipin synthase family protein [Burkholderiales bacterium]|nr:phosphatidylserine/phosphatidylglycerophosphate/cardiolipin synthase family protein [Burkholderiales bacterium]
MNKQRLKRLSRTVLLIATGLAIVWIAVRVVAPRYNPPDIAAEPTLTQFGPYRPDMNLRQAFESLPPAGGESVGLTLLPENQQSWVARWRMLDATRETLDISYFILREDVFGAAFLGHLLKKAKEGVRVRLLLDRQGTVMSFTSQLGLDWLDTLANTRRIQVKVFRPLTDRYLEAFATANPVAAVASEHDKIMVCDKVIGMIGGRNISTEYFAHPTDYALAFEDVDLILRGRNVARGLTAAFETQYKSDGARPIDPEQLDLTSYEEHLLLAYQAMDAWVKGKALAPAFARRIEALRLSWSEDLKKLPRLRGVWSQPLATEAQAQTRLLDSTTRLVPGADIIAQGLLRLVQSAQREIFIQSPYLVLSKDAIDVLAQAAARGVAITVYTNSPVSSDNAWSQAFFLEQWPELLARVKGMRLFVTGGANTLHAKLMVFDGRVAVVGTYNLDPVSMGVNSEIMAAIWSSAFSKRVAEKPRAVLARGAPTVFEYRIERDGRGQTVRDAAGRPVVAFGPENHAAPDQWRKVQTYWSVLRAAEKIPGFSPLF